VSLSGDVNFLSSLARSLSRIVLPQTNTVEIIKDGYPVNTRYPRLPRRSRV